MHGYREDSTTNYNVLVERFDSHRSLNRLRETVGLSPSVPDVGLRPSSALLIQGALASSQRARRESHTTDQRHAITRVQVGRLRHEDLVECFRGRGACRREPGHDLPRASAASCGMRVADAARFDQTAVDRRLAGAARRGARGAPAYDDGTGGAS